MLTKGDKTRQSILERAGRLATEVGLEGVTIGRLADDLELSKSGLFAHFDSKEELQMQTMEHQRAKFITTVIQPMLKQDGGEARIRALFEGWLAWRNAEPGGCFFAAASFELDDRPGQVRDRLAEIQREWLQSIGMVCASAIKRGYFRPELDPAQWAHELYGAMLSYHLAQQLLRDPRAEERLRRSFEDLLTRSRAAMAAA